MNKELQKIREEIDQLDAAMLDLLSRRAQCAQRVGEIKEGNLYRPEREAQVLYAIGEKNPGPLSDATVRHLFREIMSACLGLEEPQRVVYLGPAGTFSESAARKHFGAAPIFMPQVTIDEAVRMVEADNADYAVVPVENSTEGVVGGTLDLLLASRLKVCGEVGLRIHQHLMSKSDSVAGLRKVYSHPQSLAQCHEWLNRSLAGVERVPVTSNAEAARLAAEEEGAAAIAGEGAAELYALNILGANIEDDPRNTTRFLVLGKHDAGVSGRDKTSLVCSAPNRPGSVYKLLEPLARHNVSMSKFQSRPSRNGMWEYMFYIDIEGHRADAPVATALAELDERASFVKVLGSYPVAAI